jgi:hypothetical protein
MSGLAGVPDAAWGLAGRASRAFPNSASAPQGSPCEFALCCYFFAKSARASVYGQRRESRFGRVFRGWARFGGGFGQRAARRGVADERCARAAPFSGDARAHVSARARLPARRRARRGDWVFATSVSKKRAKDKRENRNARVTRALRERARARARGGFVARTIAQSPRKDARVFRLVGCRAASSERAGGCREEKAMKEKTEKSRKKGRKRAGRDSTLMWTARG